LDNVARAGKYIALLGLFLALLAAAAGAVGARSYGPDAYWASAVAAAMIWLVGSLGLLIVSIPRTGPGRLNAVLLAMLVRMMLPLAAVVFVSQTGPPLADAGLRGMILVHYLAALVLESYLAVRLVAGSSQAAALVAGGAALPIR
jgi:hypothetical protein